MLILELLALATSAAFAGAAIYISTSEQPARLGLDDRALLMQWKPSYQKGLEMQASLALISGLLGIADYVLAKNLWALAGGLLILANWPYTFIVIMPVNKKLAAISNDNAGPQSRALIEKWGALHWVRSILGWLATAAFFLALLRAPA